MLEVSTEEVRFAGGGGDAHAWISRPVSSVARYPAVILLHGRNGPSPKFNDVAVRFAEEGIIGLALNYMTQSDDPSVPDCLRTIDAARAFLQSQADVDPMNVILAGYCKGGGLTYLGLGNRPGFRAGVIWHGGYRFNDLNANRPEHPGDAALRVTRPMLIIHGASDTATPVYGVYELARQLNEVGAHFELKVYSGTDHAFTLPGGTAYNAENADDAFREAVHFIRRVVGLPLGTVGPMVRESVVG